MNKLLKISLLGIITILLLIWVVFNFIEILIYVGILFGCVGLFWVIEKIVDYYCKDKKEVKDE